MRGTRAALFIGRTVLAQRIQVDQVPESTGSHISLHTHIPSVHELGSSTWPI